MHSDFIREWEDGCRTTCDWGGCDQPQVGWAWCDGSCRDPYCAELVWLAICGECLSRGHSKTEGGRHRVGGSITFVELEAAHTDA